MPKSEEIRELFDLKHSSQFIELINSIYYDYPELLKENKLGRVTHDFVEFILYNIDIMKFVKK